MMMQAVVRPLRSRVVVTAARQQQQVMRQRIRIQSTSTAAPVEAAASASSTNASSASASSTKFPLVESLSALAASVGTVAAACFIVEATAPVPEFDPCHNRFDTDSFIGRFRHMLLACDPRLLLYGNESIRAAERMVQNWQDYIPRDGTDDANTNNNDKDMMHRALWEARRLSEAAVHPDTHEIIPRPFRMSGYVPYNGPICVAMVAAGSTTQLLFWSWVNQSQNAAVNYFNRNASSPMSNETLATSYAAAVGSALAVAFGLATFLQAKFAPARAAQLLKYVAFPSAVVASSLNCYIVRSPEIDTGIPLLDSEGHNVLPNETSFVAAKEGVYSTTASRALLQFPVYFLPPLLCQTVTPIARYLQRKPAMTIPVTTYLLLVSFGIGLPAAIAVFPQMAQISADNVEAKFQHLRHPVTQQPYTHFYYNKGL